MPDRTKIEWADATINPFPGCSRARLSDGTTSPACLGCYAERIAARLAENPTLPRYQGLAVYDGQRLPQWTGKLGYVPSELDKPRRWARPRTIFVESMGDIAHESMTQELFAHLWALLLDNERRERPHTFYLLTKRPGHLRELLEDIRRGFAAEHFEKIYWDAMRWVVCMTTTENQAAAEERVPELLRCPARHFGVSAEPLVGPLNLWRWLAPPHGVRDSRSTHGLGWIIAGGWSGPGATPSHPQWFRDLRDQAAEAHLPFQFKQWGEWLPIDHARPEHEGAAQTSVWRGGVGDPGDLPMLALRVGKREAGRLLDGQEYNGAPVVGLAA